MHKEGGAARPGAGDTREVGNAGERRAESFLRRRLGLSILARNWRNPSDRRDEIDLICRDGRVMVFVEVKTRSPDAAVGGYHAVDLRKKRALFRAADSYMKSLPWEERPRTFRLDVVEVATIALPDDADIRHFENVPLFPKYYRVD